MGAHSKPPPAPAPTVPPAAFPAPESISSISVKSDDTRKNLTQNQPSVKEVYKELSDINAKLKVNGTILRQDFTI